MLLRGLGYWGCWGGAVALFPRWASRPVRCWVVRGRELAGTVTCQIVSRRGARNFSSPVTSGTRRQGERGSSSASASLSRAASGRRPFLASQVSSTRQMTGTSIGSPDAVAWSSAAGCVEGRLRYGYRSRPYPFEIVRREVPPHFGLIGVDVFGGEIDAEAGPQTLTALEGLWRVRLLAKARCVR